VESTGKQKGSIYKKMMDATARVVDNPRVASLYYYYYSCCCCYYYYYRLWNPRISEYEGGLVTLGLEAGRDLLPSRVKFKEESLAVVHLADSAGLGE